jgi:hypothetical protein
MFTGFGRTGNVASSRIKGGLKVENQINYKPGDLTREARKMVEE